MSANRRPTHDDARLFMEYYRLWDTPLDGEAWTFFRKAKSDGAFASYETFLEHVPRASHEYVLFDRVLCSFEQAGVLMKHDLMHPDLYFDGWASPVNVWKTVEGVVAGIRNRNPHAYVNLEWLAERASAWYEAHDPAH